MDYTDERRSRGRVNKERTIELPTQIPMVNSILSFIAIQMEVTCSAALETRGNNIKPMKGLGMLYRSAVSSIEATTGNEDWNDDMVQRDQVHSR